MACIFPKYKYASVARPMNKLITHSFQPMRPNQPQKAKKHVIQLYGWSLTLGTTHLVIGTTQDGTEMQ
jgi:hypothetical protein